MTRQRPDQSASLFFLQRSLAMLALVAATLMLAAACRKQSQPAQPAQPGITIEHEVTPQPARVGAAVITLIVSDTTRKPLSGATITLEGNMSHAGMAPVFTTAKETEPGRYQAPIEFSMGGDWILLVHLTLTGGARLERQIEIKGVRPA